MKSKNLTILVGNAGNNPEVKTINSGKKVATFSMATNKVYKDKNQTKQTKTSWHTITCWGNLAEIAEKYIQKVCP